LIPERGKCQELPSFGLARLTPKLARLSKEWG